MLDFLDKKFIQASPNHLMILIRRYPNKNWPRDHVYNLNVPFSYVLKQKNIHELDWEKISEKDTVTWETVKSHPELFWSFDGLSSNDNVTLEIIKDNLHLPWEWYLISQRKSVTWETVEENPELPWNYRCLLRNSNTMLQAINYCDLEEQIEWYRMSRKVHFSIIKENLGYNWDWDGVTLNKSVTIEDIKNNPNLPWNKQHVRDRFITIDKIKEDPDYSMCYSNHPNITIKDIQSTMSFSQNIRSIIFSISLCIKNDLKLLTVTKNLNTKFLDVDPGIQWNERIGSNPNLVWKDIKEDNLKSVVTGLDYKGYATQFFRNSVAFFMSSFYYWDVDSISQNKFLYDYTVRKRKMRLARKNRIRMTHVSFVNWY